MSSATTSTDQGSRDHNGNDGRAATGCCGAVVQFRSHAGQSVRGRGRTCRRGATADQRYNAPRIFASQWPRAVQFRSRRARHTVYGPPGIAGVRPRWICIRTEHARNWFGPAVAVVAVTVCRRVGRSGRVGVDQRSRSSLSCICVASVREIASRSPWILFPGNERTTGRLPSRCPSDDVRTRAS